MQCVWIRVQSLYRLEVKDSGVEDKGKFLVTGVAIPANALVMVLPPNMIKPIEEIENADMCLQVWCAMWLLSRRLAVVLLRPIVPC